MNNTQVGPRKKWPIGTLVIFLIVLSASFLEWGTIEKPLPRSDGFTLFDQEPQFPPNMMDPPGTYPVTASAWHSYLALDDAFRIPNWLIVPVTFVLLALETLRGQRVLRLHRGISYAFVFYGFFIPFSSMFSFFHQGHTGWGLRITLLSFVFLGIGCFLHDLTPQGRIP